VVFPRFDVVYTTSVVLYFRRFDVYKCEKRCLFIVYLPTTLQPTAAVDNIIIYIIKTSKTSTRILENGTEWE